MTVIRGAAVPFLILLAACTGGDADDAPAAAPAAAGETGGFRTPESVRYDADLDVYFVANIDGNPSQKDGNGFIARVHPDSLGTMTMLVQGGRNGVTLHAPKGMAITGDTLWVTDIDAVRGFHKRTGAPVATVEFTGLGATFLNDIVAAPDGIYVTDTNVRFGADGSMTNPGTDGVFRIAGRTPTRVASGAGFGRPNGIAYDAQSAVFILAPFGSNTLMSWKPGDAPKPIVQGPGQFDGIEVLRDGRVLVSSWADSSVHVLTNDGKLAKLAGSLPAPADIGVDTKRNLLLVPLFNGGKVTYWKL